MLHWYENHLLVEGREFVVKGTFDGLTVNISVNDKILFTKSSSGLTYNDITNEDIYQRYGAKVIKIEQKIPEFIKAGKI